MSDQNPFGKKRRAMPDNENPFGRSLPKHSFEPVQPGDTFIKMDIEEERSPIMGAQALMTPRELLIAAGTTAATAAAPQIGVPAALSRFPALAKGAQFVANTASRMLGAGAGGAGGDLAGNLGFEDTTNPDDLFESAQTTFKNEAILEGGLGVAGAGVRKIGAAINKPATEAAKKIMAFATSINAPISVQDLRPNFLTNSIGELSELPFTGTMAGSFYRDKQIGAINDFSSQVVRKIASPPGNQAIETISEPFFKTFRSKINETKDETFDRILDPINNITTENLDQFKNEVAAIRDETSNQVIKDFIDDEVKSRISDGTLRYRRLYRLMVDLADKRAVGAGGRRDAGALRKAMKAQERRMLGNEAANALEEKRLLFSEEFNPLLNNPSLRKLSGENIPFRKNHLAANELIKSGNENVIRKFKAALPELEEDVTDLGLKVTGQDMWKQYLAQNLENLIVRSSKDSPWPGTTILDGDKILNHLDRHREAFLEAYGDETVTALENLAEFSKITKTAVKKQTGQTTMTGNFGQTLKGGANVGGMFTNPVGVVVSNGLAPGVVWGLMSPNSPLKKWLVEGSPKFKAAMTATKGTAKFGARGAAAPDSPAEKEREAQQRGR